MPATRQPSIFVGILRMPKVAFSANGKRTGLTMLELLAVIVVLFIVWSFVYPATDAIRRAALRRQAITESQALATAVLNYRDTYGHWPLLEQIETEQQQRGPLDVLYGTNLVDSTSYILLDPADLIRALTPTDTKTNNVRQIAFLEIDTDRLHNGCFLDPWSSTNNPMPYVVAVDANGDGWIGSRMGIVDDGSQEIGEIDVQSDGGTSHTIPAIQELVYVFSWSGNDTNRVSTLRQP